MSARVLLARAAGLALGLGLLTPMTTASAYVHELTPSGCNPVHWAQSCVFVTTDATGVPDMPLASVERIVKKAIDSWQLPGRSFLSLEYAPAVQPRTVQVDGWQTITFRSDTWCRPSASGSICYDPMANAVTTVTYVHDADDPANDGRITDADIELNAVDAHFYDADTDPVPVDSKRRPTDLWNTLSHELGHLQGLDHPCRGEGDSMPQCARDDAHRPVVACSEVESHRRGNAELGAIYASTMYPSSRPNDTNKRTPEADDLAAVASLYASDKDPDVCALPTSGTATTLTSSPTDAPAVPATTVSCSASPGRAAGGCGWVGLALVGLAYARRSGQRRSGRGSAA